MSETAVVIDTSALMAMFLLEEEGTQIEEDMKALIERNGQVFVPSLFWYETGNTLVTALKRKRIGKEELRGIELDLADLPIVTDPIPDTSIRYRIRELALDKKLTYYDASYLELAERLHLPLKSIDKKIIAAAG